ncbi:hypothetical protein ACIP9H_33815 [Streptomyces sp. NPDC088732]|uniref:hypothetical protein n=1 Tax=Streptomyces sp. NPDC088732 TaxID=3365879 RepID=UPI003806BB89
MSRTLPVEGQDTEEFRELARLVRALVTGADCTLQPAGDSWDIVLTTYRAAGERAIRWMDRYHIGGCGPVIAHRDSLMWLVPPGTVHRWMHERGTCFGGPFQIPVPPPGARRGPGPHWRMPLRSDHLVDPLLLKHALDRFELAPPEPALLQGAEPPVSR